MIDYLPLIGALGIMLLVFVISVAPIWRKPLRDEDQLSLAPQPNALTQHFMKSNSCPDCGGRLFKGPQGGLCTNCRCEGCGNKFNLGFAGGEVWFAERIGGKRQNVEPPKKIRHWCERHSSDECGCWRYAEKDSSS